MTNFSGVKKWWKSCEPTDEEAEIMYDILYGLRRTRDGCSNWRKLL